MKTRFLAAIALSLALTVIADAALTTNSWTSGASGKWETAGNWSAGAPTNSNAANLVTNATTKTVTIDATTTNAANISTLTISNLTVSGPFGMTNTLQLANAGTNTPLRILGGFGIDSGGALLVTNSALRAGGFGIEGDVTLLAGASVEAFISIKINADGYGGNLTINGGSLSLSGFTVSSGTVWMADGVLRITNSSSIGNLGPGQMTVSNGTVDISSDVYVGMFTSLGGRLTIAGGTNMLGDLIVGEGAGSKGTVWMTGGRLVITNFTTGLVLGEHGDGEMTVSNGTVLSKSAIVGSGSTGGCGTLTVAGGTNTFVGILRVGNQANTTGAVWVTGGQLVITNVTRIGESGVGQMTVSNGTWLSHTVTVAFNAGSQGTLTVAGGTSIVLTNLTIGNFPCAPTGTVVVAGGNLFVTNANAPAVLEVRTGSLILNSGTLTVDKLVMTNGCGSFVHTGGTLVYSNAVLISTRDDDGDGISNGYEQSHGLDPLDPADANQDNDGDGLTNLQEFQAGTDATNSASVFRITSIANTNNDVRVTWMTGTGKTNALERAAGDPGGGYSNNFAAIFTVTNTIGTTTNYLDVGAATNFHSMYYRVRVVP